MNWFVRMQLHHQVHLSEPQGVTIFRLATNKISVLYGEHAMSCTIFGGKAVTIVR